MDTGSAKYHPYPIKRKAAQLAEALIKAGASRERMEEKMKIGTRPKEERKGSSKRKMSESQQIGMSGKREKVQVGESEPDQMSDAEEEDEDDSLRGEDRGEEAEEGVRIVGQGEIWPLYSDPIQPCPEVHWCQV